MSERRDMPVIRLREGREHSLVNRHPWVFSGAAAQWPGDMAPGATAIATAADGRFLATGAVSPASQIRFRAWSFDPARAIDGDFFRAQLTRSLARRQELEAPQRTALRLVNAESDGLPGLIVDRYADYLVCQFLSAGAEFWKETIVDILEELRQPRGIYERSDVEVRRKEGMEPRTGVLRGAAPPETVAVRVAGLHLPADLQHGHKTGLYLDQAENLEWVGAHAAGREVLNCYAYTGAFGAAALRGGAFSVVNVESSAPLLEMRYAVARMNGQDPELTEAVQGDVPAVLRRFRDGRREFDLVVLDPPKFVANAGQVERGARAYKDINLLGMKLLRPGGLLMTFSCSGHVTPELFQKIVADAALDASREARIIGRFGQSSDHPVATSFPQGYYLKGLLCRVD